jgi:hypothetical protein
LDRGIITDKTVSYNCSDITLYGKAIKIVYLTDGSTTNSSYLKTTYPPPPKRREELIKH